MRSVFGVLVALLVWLLLALPLTAAETININTADAETLAAELDNIGRVRAQAIVDYRRKHGAFRSIEALALVNGVGIKTVERNRERIRLGSGYATEPVTSGSRESAARKLAEVGMANVR
ncbi:MAG: ComEA family DNA-binding protein [Pseudomonadota bacterium]|nr:ComEA family DNA-binding protein [Pseudomonadota bacterium]